MILCDYINEKEFVRKFINETMNQKISFNGESHHWLVWGAEIWLPEGGRDGFSGSLDLIATDDTGKVWLVEAKLRTNPELCPAIWQKQILPYRYGLAQLTPDTINRRSRRYLINQGAIKVAVHESQDYRHLYDAFIVWSKDKGFSDNTARELYNKTMQAIRDENIVCAVLADIPSMEVWEARPSDGKAYAYIFANVTTSGFETNVVYDPGSGGNIAVNTDFALQVKNWDELARHKQEVKPTPQSVEQYLTNDSAEYYRECIRRLVACGWSGKYHSNSKAFIVDMPTVYGPSIRIHLGWVDFDARVPMKNRLPGELGLKFNIDFRHFKKSPQREMGYSLAKQLAKTANYNGRGKGLNLRYRDLTEEEKESWDWEMYRCVTAFDRDYLGNSGERKDFEAAWSFLEGMLNSK
ncbi:MAG: hypothetical protein N2491_03730 [Negativicutes bacterium]|nr:hypothetical protein [Negativicutes bacterium]